METRLDPKEVAKWAAFNKDGHSYKDSAKHFGVTVNSLYTALRRFGYIKVKARKSIKQATKEEGTAGRDAEIYAHSQTHNAKETAKAFGITEYVVYASTQRHRKRTGAPGKQDHGKQYNSALKPPVALASSRQLFFLAQQLDKAIVRQIEETGEVSHLARMALVLTGQILSK